MEQHDQAKSGVPLLVIPVFSIIRHLLSDHYNAKRYLTFKSLDESLLELEKLRNAPALEIGNEFTFYQNLIHCAQSIEYSMIGFPQNKSPLIQHTIGRMVFKKFERRGFMHHNCDKPIPGTELPAYGDTEMAIERLKTAIEKFEHYDEALMPHYIFGKLNKKEFAHAHCMHLADHFAMITY